MTISVLCCLNQTSRLNENKRKVLILYRVRHTILLIKLLDLSPRTDISIFFRLLLSLLLTIFLTSKVSLKGILPILSFKRIVRSSPFDPEKIHRRHLEDQNKNKNKKQQQNLLTVQSLE